MNIIALTSQQEKNLRLPQEVLDIPHSSIKIGKHIYIKITIGKKIFPLRVLKDNRGRSQLVYTYDLMDHILPNDIGEELPHHGFISEEAYKLWDKLLCPVGKTDIERLGDDSLIKEIKKNSYNTFDSLFLLWKSQQQQEMLSHSR